MATTARDIAKRGKFAGKKQLSFCPDCQEYLCSPFAKDNVKCPICGEIMEGKLHKYMENGEIIKKLPQEAEIRDFVEKQLAKNAKM